MKPAQAMRLLWIAAKLDVAGEVTRKDVEDALQVGATQATADMALFRQVFPAAAVGNKGTRFSRLEGTPSIPAFVKDRALQAAADAVYFAKVTEGVHYV